MSKITNVPCSGNDEVPYTGGGYTVSSFRWCCIANATTIYLRTTQVKHPGSWPKPWLSWERRLACWVCMCKNGNHNASPHSQDRGELDAPCNESLAGRRGRDHSHPALFAVVAWNLPRT